MYSCSEFLSSFAVSASIETLTSLGYWRSCDAAYDCRFHVSKTVETGSCSGCCDRFEAEKYWWLRKLSNPQVLSHSLISYTNCNALAGAGAELSAHCLACNFFRKTYASKTANGCWRIWNINHSRIWGNPPAYVAPFLLSNPFSVEVSCIRYSRGQKNCLRLYFGLVRPFKACEKIRLEEIVVGYGLDPHRNTSS